MPDAKTGAEPGQYLSFFVAEDEYAISVLKVKEILEFSPITRVPGAPSSVRGVANVRGSVVPVVDLALRFSLPETAVTNRSCIVIVEVELDGERSVMGLVADSVNQVVTLGPDDLQPPPSFGTRVHIDYILGMGRSGQKFVVLLDIDRILAPDDLLESSRLAGLAPDVPRDEVVSEAAPPTDGPASPPSRPPADAPPARSARIEDPLEGLAPSRSARNGRKRADGEAR